MSLTSLCERRDRCRVASSILVLYDMRRRYGKWEKAAIGK